MNFVVPPGGFAGFAQMTSASKRALFPGTRAPGGKRRRKRKAKAAGGGRRRKTRKGKRKGPKFGSPAFQKLHKVGKYRR